jgi:hypothetical protein
MSGLIEGGAFGSSGLCPEPSKQPSEPDGPVNPAGTTSINGCWAISYHYEPAGPVSSNYCEVLAPADGKGDVIFLFGNISQKNVTASRLIQGRASSLLASQLRIIFRDLLRTAAPLQSAVEKANKILYESTVPGCFAALVCGRASSSGEIEICNAGHRPPMTVKRGSVMIAEPEGARAFVIARLLPETACPPVGLFCGAPYRTNTIDLKIGEALILYTDGPDAARDSAEAESRVRALSRLVVLHHALRADELIRTCVKDLKASLFDAPAKDALTLMAIKRISRRTAVGQKLPSSAEEGRAEPRSASPTGRSIN